MNVFLGIMIPFIGTTAGAACVFFMRKNIGQNLQKALLGFAAGVMVAAALWSLLIPSIEASAEMGVWSFLPAAVGFAGGVAFLLVMDWLVPHLHLDHNKPEGRKSSLSKSTMLVLAVTLHNIPEGMAVGVVFAGMLSADSNVTLASALALSTGIAIQNFPEGAVISMPIKNQGMSRSRAFILGMLSGVVEPAAAFITVMLSSHIIPALPYLLSFAAGAMIYVVVEELIPEASEGEHSNIGTIGFAAGFLIMMILDVALG